MGAKAGGFFTGDGSRGEGGVMGDGGGGSITFPYQGRCCT